MGFVDLVDGVQVLGQCKGVISAVVSVMCFRNIVPAWGWIGYGVTVVGCVAYGRCKAHFKSQAAQAQKASDDDQQWLTRVQEERKLSGTFECERDHFSDGAPHDEQPLNSARLQSHLDAEAAHAEQQRKRRARAEREAAVLDVASDGSDGVSNDDELRDDRMRNPAYIRHTGHDRAAPAGGLEGGSGKQHAGVTAHGEESNLLLPASDSQLTMKSVPTTASLRSMVAMGAPMWQHGKRVSSDGMSAPPSPPDDAYSVLLRGLHAGTMQRQGAQERSVVDAV
jgi:hypothetical protein